MTLERIEAVARVVAAGVGSALLVGVVVAPRWWWGMLGIVPLAIAFSGW